MSIIIDIVILAVIIICAIVGYIKGLTGSLINIIAFALSLVIAFVLFVPISNFIITNTLIDENLEISIKEMILSNNKSEDEKMPSAMTDYINEKVKEVSNTAKEEIVNSTAKDVAEIIVKAGTWILLFIVARIALILLKVLTSLITKLPVIKQFDKLGGVIYGLLEGLIITYFVLAMISFTAPMTKGNLANSVSKSYVGGYMYKNNLLLNLIF